MMVVVSIENKKVIFSRITKLRCQNRNFIILNFAPLHRISFIINQDLRYGILPLWMLISTSDSDSDSDLPFLLIV